MKYLVAILSLLIICTITAEAKCVKGKRVLDNVTPIECHLIRGTWYGTAVQSWHRPAKRVARPPQ